MKNLNKQKKISIISLILKLIETILTILVVAICVLIITQRLTNNEYGLLGYRLFKIETGSMIPKYNINEVILVKEIDTDSIEIEDDVVYRGNVGELNGRIITHKVVDIKEENDKKFFYTKAIVVTILINRKSCNKWGFFYKKHMIHTFNKPCSHFCKWFCYIGKFWPYTKS